MTINVTATQNGVKVVTAPAPKPVTVTVPLGKQGPPGPPGADAQWDSMTQAEYDALPDKDPGTLYVIVP